VGWGRGVEGGCGGGGDGESGWGEFCGMFWFTSSNVSYIP